MVLARATDPNLSRIDILNPYVKVVDITTVKRLSVDIVIILISIGKINHSWSLRRENNGLINMV
jgi:hypothetical protein